MSKFRQPYNNEQSKRYHQGFYKLINPDKYMGHPGAIIYRSSWELRFMQFCDTTDTIKRWHSEWEYIPYQDAKGHYHRYYPDFYIEVVDPKDPMVLNRYLVEIKPENEIHPDFVEIDPETGRTVRIIPANEYLAMKAKKAKKPKPITSKAYESYLYALNQYQKNLYKWTRAKNYCRDKGYEFKLINQNKLQQRGIL